MSELRVGTNLKVERIQRGLLKIMLFSPPGLFNVLFQYEELFSVYCNNTPYSQYLDFQQTYFLWWDEISEWFLWPTKSYTFHRNTTKKI